MSKQVFVVVREDRHYDDEITLHATRELADAAIEEFKSRYHHVDGRYRWREAKVALWLRCVECFKDGPSARIELHELEEQGQ